MKKQITYTIRSIVYDNGREQIICMTNQEYAGFLRRKGLKKKILVNKKMFTLSINLKNHVSNETT